MSFEVPPPWQPEPPPPNALEKAMKKGAANPAFHGEMFRVMLKSELFILLPAEGMEEGVHEVVEDFEWRSYHDNDGDFVPVFTSESVAVKMLERLPSGQTNVVAGMEARQLLGLLRTSENPIRVYASPQVRVIIRPEGISRLLEGDLTEARPSAGDPRTLTLHTVLPDGMPEDLLSGIRDFCSKRRVPLGVYAFHAQDPDSGEISETDLHLILWLRGTDNHFYNDFMLMTQSLAPEELNTMVGVVTPDQTEQVEFLASRPPIWPVLEPVE
jgi:hypothetical protein